VIYITENFAHVSLGITDLSKTHWCTGKYTYTVNIL